jgi:phospholipid/cholesterol/gamma-HCH transport system substrate-binding protein
MKEKNLQHSREIKTGILVVLTITVFILGFNFIKGKDIFSSRNLFVAVYKQVNGLVASGPVYINGMKVGQIKDIYFHPNNSGNIVVRFYVSKKIMIPKNTVANIFSADLLGTKAIELKLGNSKIMAKNEDTLLTSIQATLQEEVSLQMLPIKNKAEELMSSLDSALAVVEYVFNKDTRDNLRKSFESIRITIKNIEHTSFAIDTFTTQYKGRLESILINVDAISYNIRTNGPKLTNIISNMSRFSDTLVTYNLTKTINYAEKSVKDVADIVQKINSGKGSMGMLINNDSLYVNLRNASNNLNKLIEDINNNPKKYVHFSIFGRKDKQNK